MRLLTNELYEFLLGFLTTILFYIFTKDKANTFRILICSTSALTPFILMLFPYVLSILLNDEFIRLIGRWRFIVFIGCDGSGKSTHAKETVKWMREHGYAATHFHFFKNPLLKSLSTLKRVIIKVPEEETKTYTYAFKLHVKAHILPRLRPLVCYLDNLIYISFILLKNLLKGRIVIVDRYFYDFYVRFKCLGYPMPSFLRWFYTRFVPKPLLVIYMETRPEISFKRRKGEHPLWYYRKALKEYRVIAKDIFAYKINTEKPFNEVQDLINCIIRKHLRII